MDVLTSVVLYIIVSVLFGPGSSDSKQGCRNVSYHVQHLHQTSYCQNKTSPDTNPALEEIKLQIAELQAKLHALHESQSNLQKSHTRLQESHLNLEEEVDELRTIRRLSPNITVPELPTSCPENYTAVFRNSCYKFAAVGTSWYEARRACHADGAKLVAIETAKENLYLRTYILTNFHLLHGVDSGFWTSGNDILKEGAWEWDINVEKQRPMVYSDWASGKSRYVHHDCMALKKPEYHWADIPCSWCEKYICEMKISYN